MGNTLIFKRYVYQHRGCPGKFEKLWAPWLDTPGLGPMELLERLNELFLDLSLVLEFIPLMD